MKKCCCVCQICSNEWEFPKNSWRHKYSWDDVTVTWGQFLDTPFPNLDTHQHWSSSAMSFCYYGPLKNRPFNTLSRNPWWRHENFKGSMHEVTMPAISVQNFIKIEICSMAKVVRRKTVYKTYGIFPIRKKRKKKKKN